jgi:hypothetical protein
MVKQLAGVPHRRLRETIGPLDADVGGAAEQTSVLALGIV